MVNINITLYKTFATKYTSIHFITEVGFITLPSTGHTSRPTTVLLVIFKKLISVSHNIVP